MTTNVQKNDHQKNIQRMVKWFSDKGYEVIFGRGLDSQIGPDGEPEVWINSSLTKESQLYTLLHEAGHLLISERKNYTRRFSHGYPALFHDKYKSRNHTKLHWIHVVHEEMEAWEEGKRLASKKKIQIRHPKWEKYRSNALMSYMQEAVKRWSRLSKSKRSVSCSSL